MRASLKSNTASFWSFAHRRRACGGDMDDLDSVHQRGQGARRAAASNRCRKSRLTRCSPMTADVAGLRSPFVPDTPQAAVAAAGGVRVRIPIAAGVPRAASRWTRCAWSARWTSARTMYGLVQTARRPDSPRGARQLHGAERRPNYGYIGIRNHTGRNYF